MSASLERLFPLIVSSHPSKSGMRSVPESAVRGTVRPATVDTVKPSDTPGIDVPASYSRWPTLLTMVSGDVLGLLSALGFTYLAASVFTPGIVASVYASTTLAVPAMLAAFYVAGLYGGTFIHPAIEMQRSSLVLAGLAVTVALTTAIVTGAAAQPLLILGGGLLAAGIVPVSRAAFRILFARTQWWGLPAVVLSEGASGRRAIRTLQQWPEIGLRPVAHLTDARGSDTVAPLASTDPTDAVPVFGGTDFAPHFAREYGIPYAVMAMPGLSHDERVRLTTHYSRFFKHVFVVGESDGAAALWTTGSSGHGLFGYGVRNYALQPAARGVKRAFDLLVTLAALVAAAPLLATIAALIKLDDGGPVFYRQSRMGREGRVFSVLKFRTMFEDAHERLEEILASCPEKKSEYERYHKLKDDPRVTRIGRILRRTSLDELPQLFNVLGGSMSLIGPRAYMPGELPKMKGLARSVLQTPPGITGLWQVSGRNGLSFDERVDLDVHYIQNWSFWLDLYVLVRTIPVVLSGEGAS